MNKFSKEDLRLFQAESLHEKEQRSLAKISEWFSYWNNEVYVAFSGGKDSSVLADLCGFWCSIVGTPLYLVFVDTGLEFPEIRKHCKEFTEFLRGKYSIEVVLDIIRPDMRFDEVIKKYGYPIISKEVSNTIEGARRNPNSTRMKKLEDSMEKKNGKSLFNCPKWEPLLHTDFKISDSCCSVMKKKPCYKYEKETDRKPILGQLAEESRKRKTAWLETGCNAFTSKRPQSNPMAFWREQDVLQYIKKHKIPIASVYGEIEYADDPEQLRLEDLGVECGYEKLCTTGRDRTGCIFCAFGSHLEKSPSRFEMLKKTHPRQYEYLIGGGEYDENGVWTPNKKGLGMAHVFDELNRIYGEDFIKY